MEAETILILGVVVVLFAAVARRIDSTPVSGPMIFVAVGLAYRPAVDLPMADGVSHDVAELFTMLAFVVFGAVVLGPNLGAFDWTMLLYAVLSLTVIRGVAVAVSLLGSGSRAPTVAFIGWFGPRGIASVLYSFLLSEEDTKVPIVGRWSTS